MVTIAAFIKSLISPREVKEKIGGGKAHMEGEFTANPVIGMWG